MNGRSGVFKFFLFLFLGVIITLQVLSILQADRVFERLNALVGRLESSPVTPAKLISEKSSDFQEYPGDEGDWLVYCINI